MTDKNGKSREKLSPVHVEPATKPGTNPEQKPAEEETKRTKDATAQEAFDNGRWARKNAIAKDQAPLMSEADAKEWRKGWDHEDKLGGN